MTLQKIPRPLIIGHRGYPLLYPENTLVSFEAAMKAGVEMIELDVTLTRDRVPVIIHDPGLERTTNGRGTVRSKTLEELKQLDAGSWFHTKFAGVNIPTLEEVLDLVGGRIKLNLEILRYAYEEPHPRDSIEVQVVEMVRRKGLTDSILISSFEENILHHLSQIEDTPAIAFLTKDEPIEKVVQLCKEWSAFSWHPKLGHFGRKEVEQMHSHNIKVFPYTINGESEIENALRSGVDGYFTDDPTYRPKASL